MLAKSLRFTLQMHGITPATHPKLADLCSGWGAVAEMFANLGWKPEDITCIDRAVPRKSFVEGATQKYWDLEILGQHLADGLPIPREVRQYQHRFDVVVLYFGFLRPYEEMLCNYFAREGGIIAHNGLQKVGMVVWQF